MAALLQKTFLYLFLFHSSLYLYASSPSKIIIDETFPLVVIKEQDEIIMPQFPGGEEAMKKYLVVNVLTTEKNTPEWLVDRVLYSLQVTASGEIKNVKLKTPIFKLKGHISKEILDKAYWLVKNMPRWIPGTRNGNPEEMNCVVCVKINLISKTDKNEK